MAGTTVVDKAPRPCRKTAPVIMALDVDQAEVDLAAGGLACPRCAGRLRPWSWARARRIRLLDGAVVALHPRRAQCVACRSTQLLLPASCLPRWATPVMLAVLVAVGTGIGVGALVIRLTGTTLQEDWSVIGVFTATALVLVFLVTALSWPALRSASVPPRCASNDALSIHYSRHVTRTALLPESG
ncbi:hypothetical protein [Kutzneria sp. NPDC052558]|uniref:hypothetical protein n=1 Tax=Kutzneria sp. NPDC052558 TaxID=3364121 RepID=UPI0037CA78A2